MHTAVPRDRDGRTSRPAVRSVPRFTQAAWFASAWPRVAETLSAVGAEPPAARFEAALARRLGAEYVIGVGSGTDAVVLLLRAAGLRPGEEVLVPAFGSVAPAAAVVLAKARPVFVDVDPLTWAIDPAAVPDAITERTRAILVVHPFHQPADLGGLTRVADRYALTVIEDATHAIGTRWAGRQVGLFGAGGALSLAPPRTLGALGDAGVVLTDDDRLAETAAALRHHGRFGRFPGDGDEAVLPGFNSALDDVQAAVLLAKLDDLDAAISRRAEIAARYTTLLSGRAIVGRLPTPTAREVEIAPVFGKYVIEVDHRDCLADHLTAHDIPTESFTPPHRQPCFTELAHRPGDFPTAEAVASRALALPFYPELTDPQVEHVCDLIRDFTP